MKTTPDGLTIIDSVIYGPVVSVEDHNASVAKQRDAALTFAATAVTMLRQRAILLPGESEKWEAVCGEFNRALA
jgi:hypothetical protein